MSYGYKFNKEGEIIGEIDTLRYSALDSWMKSKSSYRGRYYEGKSFATPETMFGHIMHKALENGEVVLEGIPRHTKTEYNIEILLPRSDIRIGGCIDSFDPKGLSLLDYKFSHRNKDGKAPWDQVKVTRHMQLVFYSLLVKLKHEKVNPYTKLIWVETTFGRNSIEFDGHILEGDTRELKLTGKYEVFNRRIAKWELDALIKIIKRCAAEIEEDFNQYKNAPELSNIQGPVPALP